jgi:hypothetical protein
MCLSASDWILLVTALIIAWYTYETYRIRKETSKQNTLLADQLLVMQQLSNCRLKKISASLSQSLCPRAV